MFFSLMVSLIGRLGGINHIARAFFLSLIMFILIVPWQEMIGSSVVGVAYTPPNWSSGFPTRGRLLYGVLFYLRFTIILASRHAAVDHVPGTQRPLTKAILRRLEII